MTLRPIFVDATFSRATSERVQWVVIYDLDDKTSALLQKEKVVSTVRLSSFPTAPRLDSIDVYLTGCNAMLHGVTRGRESAIIGVGDQCPPLTNCAVRIDYVLPVLRVKGVPLERLSATGLLTNFAPDTFVLRNLVDGALTCYTNVAVINISPLDARDVAAPGTLDVYLSDLRVVPLVAKQRIHVYAPDQSIRWSVAYTVRFSTANAMRLHAKLIVHNPYTFDITLHSITMHESRGATHPEDTDNDEDERRPRYPRYVTNRSSTMVPLMSAPRMMMPESQSAAEPEIVVDGSAPEVEAAPVAVESSAPRGSATKRFDMIVPLDASSENSIPLFSLETTKATLYAFADRIPSLININSATSVHRAGATTSSALASALDEQQWRDIPFKLVARWLKTDLGSGGDVFLFEGMGTFSLMQNRVHIATRPISGWPANNIYRIDCGTTGMIYGRMRIVADSHRTNAKERHGTFVYEIEVTNTMPFDINAKLFIDLPSKGDSAEIIAYNATDKTIIPFSNDDMKLITSMERELPDDIVQNNVVTLHLQTHAPSTPVDEATKYALYLRVTYTL